MKLIQLKNEKKTIKLWWWTTFSFEVIFCNFYRPDENYRGLIETILGQASKIGEKKQNTISLAWTWCSHRKSKESMKILFYIDFLFFKPYDLFA